MQKISLIIGVIAGIFTIIGVIYSITKSENSIFDESNITSKVIILNESVKNNINSSININQ